MRLCDPSIVEKIKVFFTHILLNKYIINTNILISAHYWDPNSPKLLEKKDFRQLNDIKVIGDTKNLNLKENNESESEIKSVDAKEIEESDKKSNSKR